MDCLANVSDLPRVTFDDVKDAMARYLNADRHAVTEIADENADRRTCLRKTTYNVLDLNSTNGLDNCDLKNTNEDGSTRAGVMTVLSVTYDLNYDSGFRTRYMFCLYIVVVSGLC